MRVLQGVTAQAGQPRALALGLRQIGISADSCSVSDHAFAYGCDRQVSIPTDVNLTSIYKSIAPLLDSFDTFHFHGRSFTPRGFEYPAAIDLLLLKAHGKRIFFHFRGSEARGAAEFQNRNPFHFVKEAPDLFNAHAELSRKKFIELVRSVSDGLFVVDPELQAHVPGSVILPRALSKGEWPFVGISSSTKPLVIHAPSSRAFKGTDAIIDAVSSLQSEGLMFDFELVEKMPVGEARELYKRADVLIDQLRIGWYGVLAVEAMALGKVVISYVRDDLWNPNDECPFVNANPSTIRDRLREVLRLRELRLKKSRAAREYFLKNHDAAVVAKTAAAHYTAPLRSIDCSIFTAMMDSNQLGGTTSRRVRRKLAALRNVYSDSGITGLMSVMRRRRQ